MKHQMQKIYSSDTLSAAIMELEAKQAEEGKLLKSQFNMVYESVKPINLIKNTFREAAESKSVQENITNLLVGLAAGYLSKRLFEGISSSPVKKLLGTALQFGIATLVARNADTIMAVGREILDAVTQADGKEIDKEKQ